jgi:hypothetical protein
MKFQRQNSAEGGCQFDPVNLLSNTLVSFGLEWWLAIITT